MGPQLVAPGTSGTVSALWLVLPAILSCLSRVILTETAPQSGCWKSVTSILRAKIPDGLGGEVYPLNTLPRGLQLKPRGSHQRPHFILQLPPPSHPSFSSDPEKLPEAGNSAKERKISDMVRHRAGPSHPQKFPSHRHSLFTVEISR